MALRNCCVQETLHELLSKTAEILVYRIVYGHFISTSRQIGLETERVLCATIIIVYRVTSPTPLTLQQTWPCDVLSDEP